MAEPHLPPGVLRGPAGNPVTVSVPGGQAVVLDPGTRDYELARRYRVTPRTCRGCGAEWGPESWDDSDAFHAYQLLDGLPHPVFGWDVVMYVCGRCGEETGLSRRTIYDLERKMRRAR